MSPDSDTIRSAAADAAVAPLDLLLTDAATGTLRRVNPGGSGLRLAAALASRPRLVAGRGRQLLGELARIAVGSSQVQPSRRDRRFADPGWAGNPLLRRTMQAYLAAAETAEGVVADAGLDWADSERVGFVLTNLIDALSPSNNPLLNPAAVKAAVDTGGGSALAGLRHFVADMATAPRVPSMVEPDAFEVGVDLAVTPGSVILRTPVFELIQYRPATAAVRQVPLLIVPPTINKFYVMDLAPGRSMVEYLVGSGLQVFMISWRNPDARHAEMGPQHLRAGRPGRHGRGGADHRERADRARRGLLRRHHRRDGGRAPGAHRPAGPARRVHPHGHRAGRGAGGPGRRRRRRADRAAGRGRVPGPRLPGRPIAGRGVRLAAAERPDLELLGQQLPARTQAATVRHPVLERGHHPDDRGPAPGLPPAGRHERAGPARRGDHARLTGGPGADRPRQLTWSPGSPTTSAPGRAATGPPSCSAAATGSCCPPAGTSPRWSTRPETTRPGTRWPRSARRIRRSGCGARRPVTAPGGRTTRAGWPSAAARRRPPRPSPAAAGWRRSATRREPTSMTIDPSRPGPAGEDRPGSGLGRVLRRRLRRPGPAERMRILTIGGRAIRVAVREGDPGLAAAAAVQRHRREPGAAPAVRRRARSAAGGHPVRHAGHRRLAGPGRPLPPGHAAVAAGRPARPARLRAGRRPGHLLGRRARAAVRAEPPGPGAPPGAGGDRAGRADGPRASARPAAHAHAAPPPGPGIRGPHRRRAVRGQRAGRPDRGPGPAARHHPPGPGPGLLLPADRQRRLDQPAVAAEAAAAHPDPGRRRRPDHPAGQRADHAPADTAQRAAHLPRRPPRAGRRRRTPGAGVEAFLDADLTAEGSQQ